MKNILMIHEPRESTISNINTWLASFPFSPSPSSPIITFDDGLYSQYLFFKKYKKEFTTWIQSGIRVIFFISTGLIRPKEIPPVSLTKHSSYCQEKFFKSFNKKDLDYFMSLDEIIELSTIAEIGLHGHYHINLNKLSKIETLKAIHSELKGMYSSELHKVLKPTSFCFPYNIYNNTYKILLKDIKEFYGAERVNIDTLNKD